MESSVIASSVTFYPLHASRPTTCIYAGNNNAQDSKTYAKEVTAQEVHLFIGMSVHHGMAYI